MSVQRSLRGNELRECEELKKTERQEGEGQEVLHRSGDPTMGYWPHPEGKTGHYRKKGQHSQRGGCSIGHTGSKRSSICVSCSCG